MLPFQRLQFRGGSYFCKIHGPLTERINSLCCLFWAYGVCKLGMIHGKLKP